MRLTLRTMLAYMDGILKPEDAQDIAQKIEASEYATKLMHRARDVVRRLRLAAPGLADRGPGLDPNTVAEYLDNTLSDERVPDFEKVCLESDIHLAEVASCHQILTLVLGEPAEIDPAARQRMYQVPQVVIPQAAEAAPPAEQQPVGPTVKVDGEQKAAKSREKLGVPDYLREPRRRLRLLPAAAALLLVAACAALVALIATGQFESGTPLGNLLGIHAADNKLANGPGSADSAGQEPADAAATGKSIETLQRVEADLPGKVVAVPQEPAPLPPDGEIAPGAVRLPADKNAVPAEGVGPVEPRNPPGEPGEKPGPAPPAEPVAKTPEEPGVKTPTERGAEPGRDLSQPIGRLMSDHQVLLILDALSASWQRVTPKGNLLPQDRLLALPSYRPEITLGDDLLVQLLGGARLELLGGDRQQPLGLNVSYGRVVCKPSVRGGGRLRLVAGSHAGTVTFLQPESVAAFDAIRVHAPGTNPETAPAQVVAALYAVVGELLWDEPGKATARLAAPAVLVLGAAQTPLTLKEAPPWVASEAFDLPDRQASETVEKALQTDRPPVSPLLELSDHRKREVRALAIQCLAYLDRFDPAVATLNDPQMKLDWPEYIEQLRRALGRGPETAVAVRMALEKQYGQSGPELYRMLWGYTDKDLRGGDDAKLVKFLDHETLAVRVLSAQNLKDITGKGGYQAELSAAKRLPSLRTWQKRLSAGEIVLRTVPEPGKKPPAAAEPPPEPTEKEL